VATFENTVTIRRPIEDVFAFLADFENIPKWNYAIVETHKVSEGVVGVGTIYQQVRSVPSRSESASRSPPTTLPATWRYEANSGRSHPASPMPWTPSQREPGSPTRSSSNSAARAVCWGESPCHVSGTPWPPTSTSSRNCWTDRLWGTLGAQTDGIHGSATDSPGN
jgi:uncharacterized protein YndB with AHSA1/START domain